MLPWLLVEDPSCAWYLVLWQIVTFMAIPEVCQVWIEQRIEEALEDNDSEQSLRSLGKEISADIERLFNVKVNPRTLEKRAERARATNVAPAPTPQPSTEIEEKPVAPVIIRDDKGQKNHRRIFRGSYMWKIPPCPLAGSPVSRWVPLLKGLKFPFPCYRVFPIAIGYRAGRSPLGYACPPVPIPIPIH